MLPKVTDNIFRSNPLSMKLHRKGTKLDGGAYITQNLIYAEGPGGAFEGLEPLDVSEAEIITTAVYNWKHYYASVTIRRMDELKNRGRAAFGRLLTSKMRTAEKTMRNLIGQGIYSDGSTNTKLITGLRAMVTTGNVTYGGINKQTNTWWASQVDTNTALTISRMRTLMGQCTEDADTPDIIVGPQAQYDNYYDLLTPQQRFASKDMARGGFTSILFEGRPFVVDSHCPAGFVYFLNTDYIDFVSHEDENMRFEKFRKPYNQAGRTAFIFWAGNLTGSNCRYQGVFTSLT
jgi:hypothetical protein